ncbi:NADH:ubiquinone oxidoreductase 17.2 kD subunit [Hoeflea phototrophica DFL-43]|jgi:NADH:ubiquinone oxidoreductase subunit|uniref:NADH:ubiquinone oxidoreductase 17.2 kD subunit n=1 Tax=Hoeflea phototrophica (strain DSM 17068 / NCIMB 14078 / DFL-43) TaxID=411684 RepID=A9D571_HOEPD|nr:NADH:ubiquinone oxidoreductase subunit NDUFA12 [Hoeflea phototrophica]EDQ34049.1 NADH:ubiquinone oxidoreductase 17.2 kD subunit [Hoeflea phototrophica DFL-43]
MKTLLLQIFTWWSGQTIGVRFHTWRNGERVGEDAMGNVYYQGGKDSEGRTRRWVIYNGPSEPSMIPPGWHGWMHHRTDVAPPSETYAAKPWEKPHQENLTGTGRAYRPKGSILNQGARPTVTGDYDAWTPKS